MPVKLGQKRGSYKKKIKDEKIDNSINNVETPNVETQPTINNDIEQLQNEKINQNEIDSINRQTNVQSNVVESNIIDNDVKQQSERTEFQQTSGEDKLNSFFNEYQQTDNEPTNDKFVPESTPIRDEKLKMIINGYMLLSICDIVFPYGIKFLFGLFNPKAKKVSASDLKLEPEQRAALLPAADQVAQYVFEKANPMTIFIICMGLFYGTNFSNALNEIKDK
jgi:hypothetical protein